MQDLLSYFRSFDPESRQVVLQVLRIAGILVAAWALQAVAVRSVRVFRSYMERRMGGEELARIDTLTRVFRNAAAIVIAESPTVLSSHYLPISRSYMTGIRL